MTMLLRCSTFGKLGHEEKTNSWEVGLACQKIDVQDLH